MRNTLVFVAVCCLCFLGAAADGAGKEEDLLGTFTSRPTRQHADSFTESIVELLEVKRDGDGFTLEATMNVMNREDGMDHVSNTMSHWTGRGKRVGAAIRFTYEATGAGSSERGQGVFRRAGRGFVLKVDDAEYPVRRNGL